MIELIDLSDWKKQKDILIELNQKYGLNITSREWRNQVEKWNKRFARREVDFYITHSNIKGFKATRNYQEALEGRNDYLSRAYNMIKKAKECDEGFQIKDNLQMDFDEGKIV